MDLLAMENIIATQLKVRVTRLLSGKFASISFTTEVSDEMPTFPNVYIHELEPTELGMSLENKSINALRDTIQVMVSTNTTKSDARLVSNAVVDSMKALKFTVVTFPVYSKVNNLHTYVMRFQRVIASADEF